jgi:hypothetical protein
MAESNFYDTIFIDEEDPLVIPKRVEKTTTEDIDEKNKAINSLLEGSEEFFQAITSHSS